jgi:hypothetical protein
VLIWRNTTGVTEHDGPRVTDALALGSSHLIGLLGTQGWFVALETFLSLAKPWLALSATVPPRGWLLPLSPDGEGMGKSDSRASWTPLTLPR